MKSIQELLDAKGSGEVHCIGPDDTVFDAVTRMVELRVGALLVLEIQVDDGGRVELGGQSLDRFLIF